MNTTKHVSREELEAGLLEIRRSPQNNGILQLIVRRPQTETREVLPEARLDLKEGLSGDNWKTRRSSQTPDGSPHPDTQLTLMNARFIQLIAGDRERWPLAGDQLFIDLDLSLDNLPVGTQLAIGRTLIEITALPHTGCKKFVARFGQAAQEFISSPVGTELRLRGVHAKVISPGIIQTGDSVTKVSNA